MTEGSEVRAFHQEVEAFVGKLRDFHDSLDESEQAMLGTVLEAAQQADTGGFGMRGRLRYNDATQQDTGSGSESASGWNDLIGWIEGQGEEDTQGFGFRRLT